MTIDYKHDKELRTREDLDPYNVKTRAIPFDEVVAVVKHQGDYGDLTVICTINELLDKLKEDDYSVTHSKTANRIYANNVAQNEGYSVVFEYYPLM